MDGGLLSRAVVTVLLSVAVAAVWASPAQAHTELDTAIPAEGATLPTTPGSIQLNFTEPIDAELASIVVRGPEGRNLAVGSPRQSGPGLMQPISPSAAAGTVQVAYRVVSLDGHPVSDSFAFEVLRGDPSAAVPAGPDSDGAAGDDGAAGAAGDEAAQGGSLPVLLAGAAAVLVLVLAGAVLARRRRVAAPGPQASPRAP